MSDNNKTILEEANAAITQGDYEGFLAFCAEETEWTFVGEQTLKGKDAVRRWMAANYAKPPQFTVAHMVAEGDFVVAVGDITTEDETGKKIRSQYSDVWRFRNAKMIELKAFVVRADVEGKEDGV